MTVPPTAHTTLPAEYFDGESAQSIQVYVEWQGTCLCVVDTMGPLRARWESSGLQYDGMHEGTFLHVTHRSSPEAVLVVRDPVLAERIRHAAGRVETLPGGDHKLRFALALLATLLLLGGLLYRYVPQLARAVAVRIPLEEERAIGLHLESLFDAAECTSQDAEAALRDLSKQLSDDPSRAFQVHVMTASFPNAFALPGGTIVVTDSLLREAESPDEVAGVLAHEIEHVVQRHVLAGFLRDAALSALWSVTMGDYSGLMMIDPSTAYRIKNLSFSRTDEDAADRGAATRLHHAGISHRGLISFFQRLQAKLGADTPAWLSTHPSTAARIAQLERTRDVEHPRPALDAERFQALRAACVPAHGTKRGVNSTLDATSR
jgi:Zn-dependent protease with chaperone function